MPTAQPAPPAASFPPPPGLAPGRPRDDQPMVPPQFPPPPPLPAGVYPVVPDAYFGGLAPIGHWVPWMGQLKAVYYHLLDSGEEEALALYRAQGTTKLEQDIREGRYRLACAVVAVDGRLVEPADIESKLEWVRRMPDSLRDQLLLAYQIVYDEPAVLTERMFADPNSAAAPGMPGASTESAATSANDSAPADSRPRSGHS